MGILLVNASADGEETVSFVRMSTNVKLDLTPVPSIRFVSMSQEALDLAI